MKKLFLLSVAFLSVAFVGCSNNDDSGLVQETPTISIQTGSFGKGLFIVGSLLDKVTYSNGSVEVFEYNSSSKLEKVTFYSSGNTVLYTVDFTYSLSGELSSLIKETNGSSNKRVLTLSYNSVNDITIDHSDVNIQTSVVTPSFVSNVVFDENNIVSYSSFGNQINYSFEDSNSLYSNLSSIKELAFYYRLAAVQFAIVSDKNVVTEDLPGADNDSYYEYEYNALNEVVKINKFNSSSNTLYSSSVVNYN